MNNQYQDLTSHIRKIQAEEFKKNNFPHLRLNKKKSPLPNYMHHDFVEERYRVRFLFREGMDTGNNKRNLETGRTEIVIEHKGVPYANFKDGFALKDTNPIRVCIGDYLFDDMLDHLFFLQSNYKLTRLLEKGSYENYVKQSLYNINSVIESFKETAHEPKYMKNKIIKQQREIVQNALQSQRY